MYTSQRFPLHLQYVATLPCNSTTTTITTTTTTTTTTNNNNNNSIYKAPKALASKAPESRKSKTVTDFDSILKNLLTCS